MIHDLLLQPRDPLLVRDGRPFTSEPGARARSLSWPLPHTVAGAIRSHIGRECKFEWDGDGPDRARAICLHGSLPVVHSNDGPAVCVPSPMDAVFFKDGGLMRLRPDEAFDGANCAMPHPNLLPMQVTRDEKVEPAKPLWPINRAVDWLARAAYDAFEPNGKSWPVSESRVHVEIAHETQAARTGHLYATESLCFGEESSGHTILSRVETHEDWQPGNRLLPLGGERRLAYIRPADKSIAWPTLSGDLSKSIRGARRLRLQLVTPAIFQGGWRPGWLDESLKGTPPSDPSLKVRLVGVISGRPVPVSGWSLDRSNGRKPGPKPARYAVAAGSVYFFEVVSGAAEAAPLFLSSISDQEEDRNDGFGLTIPGVW